MAYTRHGHHIPGTPTDDIQRSVARCGGPGLCSKCAIDASAVKSILEVRERDDMYRTPLKFALRPTHHNIEAMQMAGDMYDIMAVLTWLQRNGYAWFHPAVDEEVNKAFYIDEDTSEVVLEAHGVIRRIRQGDWIAKNQNGELNVYSPEEFRKLYMPVD